MIIYTDADDPLIVGKIYRKTGVLWDKDMNPHYFTTFKVIREATRKEYEDFVHSEEREIAYKEALDTAHFYEISMD